jgi:hypothetical protein
VIEHEHPPDDAALFVAEPSLTPIDRPAHEQALAAAREKRWSLAKRLLGHLAAGYPDRPRILDQYNAVVARLADEQRMAKDALEGATLRALPAPPWGHTLATRAPITDPTMPRLSKRSERPNGITDDEKWFSVNQLHTPEYFVPPAGDFLFAPGAVSSTTVANRLTGFAYTEIQPSARYLPIDLPSSVPLAYGTIPLRRMFASPPYTVCIYGSSVVAVFEGASSLRALLDFAAYEHPPSNKYGTVVVGQATLRTAAGTQTSAITATTDTVREELDFALARSDTLYVQHSYNGYTKDAAGQTGYVTALDLGTGGVLWRSAPMVANAASFVLDGGGVLTAYGFTAEPRFLYVLDAATGITTQKLSIRATPETLLEKGGTLHVRAYDTDYLYNVR